MILCNTLLCIFADLVIICNKMVHPYLVPERPSRSRLADALHYSPLFEIRAPWLGPHSTKVGSFHSQANLGYCCHQCNGPCGDRTPGRSFQSPTPKPLGHRGTSTTQSFTLGWFITRTTIKIAICISDSVCHL